MKYIFCFFLLISSVVYSQKEITLKEIWSGKFRTERLQEIQHLKNGNDYTILEIDRVQRATKIVSHSYKGESSKTILSSADIDEMDYFTSYKFSEDESKLLLGNNISPVYRYSSVGNYYVYNISSKEIVMLSDKLISNPSFSPDATKVAYTFQNNIYVYDLEKSQTIQVTEDGKKNTIINGSSDWVYEEEFELTKAYEWSADGTEIAYLKFNENEVKEYQMPLYGDSNYPEYSKFKYPKAGEKNSVVTAHVFKLKDRITKGFQLKNNKQDYIPRLKPGKQSSVFYFQILNRAQNHLKILKVNSLSEEVSEIYEEKDKAYIEINNHFTLLENEDFILTSEKDGYNHLYLYSKKGKLIKQITKGNWEVTEFYGEKKQVLYYQSTAVNSTERHVFSVRINGKDNKRLTSEKGIHEASFNSDFSIFIETFSNTIIPYTYRIKSIPQLNVVRTLVKNDKTIGALKDYSLPSKELSVITIEGIAYNTWTVKPPNFDPQKKYPVLLYQYSGPGYQTVKNSWNSYNDYWHRLLAQKGYIVVSMDGRGTGGKGAKFKKQTQFRLGKLEAQDQIAFANELAKLPYVDKNRIGIWGWSYGGFTSLNAILKGNGIFKMAIAVAPVTHWKFYDTIYTERFLSTPESNKEGYEDNSPINFANLLKGDLLIIHGTADDNVHLQNTLSMAEALTQANKQFDMAIYTDKNHGIYGGNTRLQLYTKMTNYILEKL